MNLRFPGQQYDAETGLHYNYYRDYDPASGRYLQPDPIGLRGGTNPYGYVAGNPVTYLDSDGLERDRPAGARPGLIHVDDASNRVTQAINDALCPPLICGATRSTLPSVKLGSPKSRSTPYCVPDASNYRKLFKDSRPGLPDDWPVHHSIPRRYEELFYIAGINIHDLQFLRGVHPRLHDRITAEWSAFHRRANNDPTAAQVAEFAKHIDEAYGEKFMWPGF
jgi:RHS repeat-associated protein